MVVAVPFGTRFVLKEESNASTKPLTVIVPSGVCAAPTPKSGVGGRHEVDVKAPDEDLGLDRVRGGRAVNTHEPLRLAHGRRTAGAERRR